MKKTLKITKPMVCIIISMLMIFGMAGCKSTKNVDYGSSDDEWETIESEIVVNADNGGTNQNKVVKKKTSGKSGAAAEYNDNEIKRKYKADAKSKENFLDKVPSNLKGKTVKILTWWPTLEFEKKKMEVFTKKTGIKINWIYAKGDEYMQKLSALKTAGNSPDIACVRVENYPSAIMQNYFKPLSAGNLKYDKNVYDLESMNLLKWNGQYYGAIFKGTTHITMGLLMYNADLFSKYGVTDPHTLWKKGTWNWNQFVKTGQEIQKKSGVTALTAEYQGFRLAQTCGQDAVKIVNGKLTNNTANKDYRDAYKWINDLSLEGQYKIADFGLNRDGFMNGKSAMMVEETWALQTGERYKDNSFTIGYAPLPCKTTETVIPCDAQLWGFPVGSKNTDAAAYALEYWMNPLYDEAGYNLWVNDSAAAFCDWLWTQKKVFKVSEGVIDYGGDYKWSSFQFELSSGGKANVDSNMDKWSSVIEGNIKKIYKEFG